MELYYIAYDLDKPGQDYPDLWDELKRIGAKRVQDSVWALKSNNSVTEIRDAVKTYMDSNDRLLVVRSATWAGRKLMSDPNKL